MDELRESPELHDAAGDLSRRDFVALSAAATGLAAAPAFANGTVVEKDVTIKTPDGVCDAAYFAPSAGTHPGVVLWPDAFGLRPAMREMARRLATSGYAVLVPNPFYRIGKAPFYESAANVDFHDDAVMARLKPLMGSIGAAGAVEKDAPAFVAFLDAQPQVDKSRKIGTQGYCMGGALVVRTAATVPERIGAGASFHGGGLVTDKPDSPHLLAPKIKARMYFAVASNDDQKQPDAKDKLRKAFEDAKVPVKVEVYAGRHGWCVPDMPSEGGAPLYDKPDAEKAWAALLAHYKTALA
jgi:carboxymethylenebutenolidase